MAAPPACCDEAFNVVRFAGAEVHLPPAVPFAYRAGALLLDFSAGFRGQLLLHRGAPPPARSPLPPSVNLTDLEVLGGLDFYRLNRVVARLLLCRWPVAPQKPPAEHVRPLPAAPPDFEGTLRVPDSLDLVSPHLGGTAIGDSLGAVKARVLNFPESADDDVPDSCEKSSLPPVAKGSKSADERRSDAVDTTTGHAEAASPAGTEAAEIAAARHQVATVDAATTTGAGNRPEGWSEPITSGLALEGRPARDDFMASHISLVKHQDGAPLHGTRPGTAIESGTQKGLKAQSPAPLPAQVPILMTELGSDWRTTGATEKTPVVPKCSSNENEAPNNAASSPASGDILVTKHKRGQSTR